MDRVGAQVEPLLRRIEQLRGELAALPGKMAMLRAEIEAAKAALQEAKKEATQLQLTRKQKELDLDAQEAAIRKHSTELNAVKTNDAYRALLGEIEKAKQEKSVLEDHILQLLDQIDQASRLGKEKEAVSKANEVALQKQISDCEDAQKALEQTLASKESERAQALSVLSKNLADHYSKIRNGKRGAAVVPIRREQCTGCHMKVSQNLINEVRRGQKIMTCESCSRIVYLEEVIPA